MENTLQKILTVAKEEFLDKGFRGASLRAIVKKVGVTTGAFYGYYKSKEELFDALVKDSAEGLMKVYLDVFNEFFSLSKEEQKNKMFTFSKKGMEKMFDYIYTNPDALLLILKYSDGTKYENFLHELVEKEIESSHEFYKVIREFGYQPIELAPQVEHIIVSGMFTSLFELVIHKVPRDQAEECMKQIHAFFVAGWERIMTMA